MRAGRMDRRVRLLRQSMVDGGMARIPGDYVALAECAAQFVPGRGTERREMAGTSAVTAVGWRVRWSTGIADLNPADRLVEIKNGVAIGPVYDISSVVELGRREGLEITATARADG